MPMDKQDIGDLDVLQTTLTKEELIAFEDDIRDLYSNGKIKAPIHLSGGNEDKLIELFKRINRRDWIFSTWRNHYHWLLSGRSPERLKKQILEGNSMAVFDRRRGAFFTSAIVGGVAPIALGVALAIQLKRDQLAHYRGQCLRGKQPEDIPHPNVYCFVGDMGSECGIVKESIRYAEGHDLPVKFIIEDNGLSVTTKTQEVWGKKGACKSARYKHTRKYPHAGTGKYVLF